MATPTAAVDGFGDQSEVMRLLWGKQPDDGPRRGPKPAFTIEQITRTGIKIADTEGIAALTMQRVADELGFTKMALYRYVPGKDELVALMTDAALDDPPPLTGCNWRDRLDEWGRLTYEQFLKHPWVLQTTVGARVMGPNELSWLEVAVEALRDTGLAGDEKIDVAVTVIGHVRAIAEQWAAMGDRSEADLGRAMVGFLSDQPDRYPALLDAFGSATQMPTSRDRPMGFGLARILDGVDLLISSREG
jgi:AcrR family transcriptional regulator